MQILCEKGMITEFECVSDGGFERLFGSCPGRAKQWFELGPGLFDRVQVWRVGRRIEELRANLFNPFPHRRNLV